MHEACSKAGQSPTYFGVNGPRQPCCCCQACVSHKHVLTHRCFTPGQLLFCAGHTDHASLASAAQKQRKGSHLAAELSSIVAGEADMVQAQEERSQVSNKKTHDELHKLQPLHECAKFLQNLDCPPHAASAWHAGASDGIELLNEMSAVPACMNHTCSNAMVWTGGSKGLQRQRRWKQS